MRSSQDNLNSATPTHSSHIDHNQDLLRRQLFIHSARRLYERCHSSNLASKLSLYGADFHIEQCYNILLRVGDNYQRALNYMCKAAQLSRA